jgi:hypothetical protein
MCSEIYFKNDKIQTDETGCTHVIRVNAYTVSVGKPQRGDYFRNVEVEGRIIIWTYRPIMERVTGIISFRVRSLGDLLGTVYWHFVSPTRQLIFGLAKILSASAARLLCIER